MSTTIDTFIYLKRDIEQSFQRVQTIFDSSHYNPQELDQLFNHISCTLDDLQKINQLLLLSSNLENTHPLEENDFDDREEFVRRMKAQLDFYTNKIHSIKKDAPMEIIRLDQAPEDEENEDQIIRKQEQQLDDFHLSIVSLKNLTQNINLEINDHIRVLDNLETNMISSQNRVTNLTNRTKTFLRTSADGIGGHTCLFCIAVVLFFLIVILILFF